MYIALAFQYSGKRVGENISDIKPICSLFLSLEKRMLKLYGAMYINVELTGIFWFWYAAVGIERRGRWIYLKYLGIDILIHKIYWKRYKYVVELR